MANWAHSSISTTFGLKLHLILNASRKFVKFSLKPGNLHDVSCGEEVLAGCTGTVIGDSRHVSTSLRGFSAKGVYSPLPNIAKTWSRISGKKKDS
jgi:hypothetical protein